MTDQENDSEEDIALDVLPVEVSQPAVPIELTQLFPWHRPRKQFIRERQWIMYSKSLITRLLNTPALPVQLDGTKEVKYLSLPGIDYLDVQLLSECCKELDCVLTNTGFLSAQEGNPIQARANLREEALIEGKHISMESKTFSRKLEEISSISSSAYRDLRRRGPFHIINIDACGSIAPAGADHSQRMIDAIYRIAEYQFDTYSGRWLMFLTADVRFEQFNDDTFERLLDAIKQNAAANSEFETASLELFSAGTQPLSEALNAIKLEQTESYVRLFSLGFSKWLLHLAQAKGWEMKMHNSYFYSTTPQPEDTEAQRPTMPCLAFEFIPPSAGLIDPHSVANVLPAVGGITQDTSMRALEKTRNMTDLDAKLDEDDDLRKELNEKTISLLRNIGYAAAALDSLSSPEST